MKNKTNESWHGAHHYSHKVHLFLIIFLFLTAAALFWTYITLHDSRFSGQIIPAPAAPPSSQNSNPILNPDQDGSVFCTQEAKLCPDGSYVGRAGPNCEFRACPIYSE